MWFGVHIKTTSACDVLHFTTFDKEPWVEPNSRLQSEIQPAVFRVSTTYLGGHLERIPRLLPQAFQAIELLMVCSSTAYMSMYSSAVLSALTTVTEERDNQMTCDVTVSPCDDCSMLRLSVMIMLSRTQELSCQGAYFCATKPQCIATGRYTLNCPQAPDSPACTSQKPSVDESSLTQIEKPGLHETLWNVVAAARAHHANTKSGRSLTRTWILSS